MDEAANCGSIVGDAPGCQLEHAKRASGFVKNVWCAAVEQCGEGTMEKQIITEGKCADRCPMGTCDKPDCVLAPELTSNICMSMDLLHCAVGCSRFNPTAC